MRGKPAAEQGGGGIPRITPAGAGKTLQRTAVLNAGQDHPRRCGENLKLLQPLLRGLGSPPQVRGKPELSRIILMSHRITPAGAGKTPVSGTSRVEPEDHPRRCGENPGAVTTAFTWAGSPPQVRGKPYCWWRFYETKRITPAGAGKTLATLRAEYWDKDHPRRCGENLSGRLLPAGESGSPPQVRGKLNAQLAPSTVIRITPAGAGKT